MRSLLIFLILLCHLTIGGCVSTPSPLSPESRMKLERIGIVALPSTPRVEFHTFAKGWAAGVAKGGGLGMVEGLLSALMELHHNPPSGQFAGPLILITLAVGTAVSTAVYAVAGGFEAVSSKTAQEIDQELNAAMGDVRLSNQLAEKMITVSISREDLAQYTLRNVSLSEVGSPPAYKDLFRQGINSVLEVQVTEAGFRGGSGSRPLVSFYLNTRMRLLATDNGREIYTRDFQYMSRELPFTEWFADEARMFMSGIRRAMDTLADRIIDELFLVTNFPFDSGLWALPGKPEFGTCWFYPIYPELKYTSLWYSMKHNMPGIHVIYTKVDSLQPLFTWEDFPRPRDRKPDNEAVLKEISDVTYDLKVWETTGDYPERLVHDISKLQVPQYRPASPLKPMTKYFWTFRARYKLSGQSQVTRWAFSNIPSNVPSEYPQRRPGGICELDAIPSTNYFRFITPD